MIVTRNDTLILAALVGGAALLFSRRVQASSGSGSDGGYVVDDNGLFIEYTDPNFSWDNFPSGSTGDPYYPGDSDVMTPPFVQTPANDYLGAFLYMIGAAETTPQAMASGSAYHTFYGGSLFESLADHPVLTGEKVGVRLSDEMCRNAGFNPGCVSTAAGAFQITLPTWKDVRKAGIWGPYLRDFSRESQIEAARRILILCGALDYVTQGEFAVALNYASKRWASLPGSTAKQRPKAFEKVYAYYQQALGISNA